VSEPEVVLGRLVKGEIARGEPILNHRLFPKDLASAPGIMSVLIPPGKRAMTVGVNEVIGVSGFILPKNRVDVIATRTDARAGNSTETILQNVEVLAAGERLDQRAEQHVKVPTVTIAVTPEEAERLARALHEGKIHIVLRSVMELDVVHLAKPPRPSPRRAEANAAAPPPRTRPTAVEAPGGKGLVVDVIRGDKRSLETHAAQ
jgi:pilus assembly protein CpaB